MQTRLYALILLVFLGLGFLGMGPAVADPPENQPQFGSQPVPSDSAKIGELFQQLGASEFAARERAAGELTELGVAVVPEIRKLVANATDPEVQIRGQQIVQQLTDGDMAGRIDAFLAGGDDDFPGWPIIQSQLGDSGGVRELFIALMKEHPEILVSLGQTTRDRVLALEKTMSSVEDKMFKQFQFPSKADTFALFVPVLDPALQLGNRYEPLVLSVLFKEAASKIRRDAQLADPLKRLMTKWIVRSSQDYRDSVLRLTMEWGLPIGITLGLRTLAETHGNETMSSALQAIARFGGPEHVAYVLPLLDDTRAITEQGFVVSGQQVETLLGDVAMATIARLYKQELTELGIPPSADHPTFSFLIPDIGFARDDPKSRATARAKIQQWIQENEPAPVSEPEQNQAR